MASWMKWTASILVLIVLNTACAKKPISAHVISDGSNESSENPPITDPEEPPPQVFSLKAQVDKYKQRYNLTNPDMKLVDNRGNGHENLYGARNVRVVLHGVYYRGGANNKYNKHLVRDNSNPLQNHALDNLCEEGFSEAIYMYPENYSSARKLTNCRNFENEDQNFDYLQVSAFTKANLEPLLTKIYKHIKGEIPGPIYGHCWNGWHASGYIAALSLRQFCGWNGAAAEAYWIKNTDGDSDYPTIKQRIRDFVPLAHLQITDTEKSLICP